MVECSDEPDVPRQQHAVAEHVARHVADPRDGEVGRLRIDAHFAEMALDRFPRAARGDAHRLVVVARGAAGGERVAQPEPVFLADAVRVVGERRRALVGCDDEVRIVGIAAPDARRGNDGVADAVVGEVQQTAQVILVAGDAFLHHRLAIRRGGCALQHEAALRADGHDHRVLDHLRLDEPQHLGAEILGPIRPSQAAACDLAAAQVHAFEARRVDEDLEHRLRLRQSGHLRRIELERQEALRRTRRVAAPVVGARRRHDQREVLAQHAVLGQVVDPFQRLLDRAHLLRLFRFLIRWRFRIEAQLEQRDELRGNVRMRRQRCLDERLRQREADLPQVPRVGAQDRDFRRRQAGGDDEPVEVVALDVAAEDAAERILEQRVQRIDLHSVRGRCDAGRDRASRSAARPSGAIRCGRSSSTFIPIRSSIGRLSDSATGSPRRNSLKRSAFGAASSGR